MRFIKPKFKKNILIVAKSSRNHMWFLRMHRLSQAMFTLFFKEFPKPGDFVFLLYLAEGFGLRTFCGLCLDVALKFCGVKNATITVKSLVNGMQQNFYFLSPFVLMVKCDQFK